MEESTLRQACERRPFRRFVVVVADGSRLAVPHPEFISLDPEERTVIVWKERSVPVWVDVASITAIDFQFCTPRSAKAAR
jgi:hypothetical protein